MCILCQLGAGLFAPSTGADTATTGSVFFADAPEAVTGLGSGATIATPQSVAATGGQYVSSLLSGSSWGGRVTFSFPSASSQYSGSYNTANNEPTASGFGTVSGQMQDAVRSILLGTGAQSRYGSYASVINLQISEAAPGSADIQIAQSGQPATAYTYYPGGNAASGDVWFGTRYNYSAPTPGTYAWLTAIHELGHAMGLKHTFDTSGTGAMPTDRDAMEYSVMSYRSYAGQTSSGYTNGTYDYAQTLMMYDIAALQQMYGANFSTNGGSSTYTWNPQTGEMSINGVGQGAPGGGGGGAANRVFETIWDGGGSDTYDLSNYATNVSMDLTPGGVTNFGTQLANLGSGRTAAGNVYNALQYQGDARSLIENGITGSGNDAITGNDAANLLMGMGGNDTLSGGAGDDQLFGNQGADWLDGGIGNDQVFGGRDNDIGYGSDGNDQVFGNLGNDLLYGGAGNDTLYGGQGDDVLDGSAGDDVLSGDLGADRYVFTANAGRDLILGFNTAQGDRIDLQGQTYTVSSAADGFALLTLSGGGTVEIAGWTSAQINGSPFA